MEFRIRNFSSNTDSDPSVFEKNIEKLYANL